MLGILVTGGETPDCDIVLPSDSPFLLAAADSGLDFVNTRGWKPDIIVGDMDSIRDPALIERYPDASIRVSPRDKDETDTELGLIELWNRGASRVTMIGGGGGRLDHLLAVVSLFARTRSPKTWLTRSEVVECLEGAVEVGTTPGETISFFPVGLRVEIDSSSGFQWPLDGFSWTSGDFGVSNRSVSTECRVVIRSGRLLMVRHRASATIVLS